MVHYRRVQSAGSDYFFTVNLKNRQTTYLTDHVNLLRESFREVKTKYPFAIEAIVILPEHIHTIWSLPPGDANYPVRWQLLKSLFTRKLVESGIKLRKNARGEYNLWQRRYWEHAIRDELDMQKHIEYIHYNPVKHGLVNRVKDWPYSSFHGYVDAGMTEADWGSSLTDKFDPTFGERSPDSAELHPGYDIE